MPPAELAPQPSHSRHIVLAVGNARDGDTEMVEVLLRAGFDAVAVESAAATLALMAGGLEPCLVIVDVDEMPHTDAWQLWNDLRRRDATSRPGTLILSYDRIDATLPSVQVEEFVRKPIADDRLIAAVERHCPRRLFPKFTSADER